MPKIKRKKSEKKEHDLSSGLSEYEKQRLKRIEANESFLKSLNLFDAKMELQTLSKKPSAQSRSTLQNRFPKKISLEEQPRRLSLRLRNLQPDGTEQRLKPQIHVQPVVYPERVRPAGPLAVRSELFKDDKEPSQFLSLLKSTSLEMEIEVKDWSKCYKEEISKFYLKSEHVVKVTKERILSLDIHPSPSHLIIAAGDRVGGVGIWNVNSVSEQDSLLYQTVHCCPVKSVIFPSQMSSSNVLYSASYDGSIRRLDLVKEVFDEVYVTSQDDDSGISHISLGASCQWMLASCSNGRCMVVDERSPNNPASTWSLHRRAIKTVHVNPADDNLFVTACVDGDLMTWDLRALKPKNPKHFQHVWKAEKSVSSAYFSPSGRRLLATSMDNKVSVFECDGPAGMMKSKVSLRHDNQTGRWLTNFRAVWDPKNEDYFVVGSMARPRQVEIYSVASRHPVLCLSSEWLTSVCSINAFHPQSHTLAGANSSGRVHIWEPTGG